MYKKGLVGFIGLGIMGKPMASNLIKAGYKLIVHDIVRDVVDQMVAQSAEAALNSREVALKCNGLIITMLPNSPEVKEVVLSRDGILEGAKPGTIVVDMSSISPIAAQEICKVSLKKGVVHLDCPVSGGEPKAIDGTLAIMCGGNAEAFEKVKDILLVMGSSAILIGESGSGNICKLANQIIVALNIAAMSEALTFATKAGVDPEKVYQAIRGGLAGSTVLNAKTPMVLSGNYKPGFRIELHIKDLKNTLETADAIKSPIPLSREVIRYMEELANSGHSKEDHGGLIQYYENLAGIKVCKKK